MDGPYLLGLLLLVIYLLAAPIWAVSAARAARRKAEELEAQLRDLKIQMAERVQGLTLLIGPLAAAKLPPPVPERTRSDPAWDSPTPSAPHDGSAALDTEVGETALANRRHEAPHDGSAVLEEEVPSPGQAFTLEQFMGAKLFAWVGGLALFLGLVFFVKLSIERGWISAELRTAMGYAAGLGLVVAGRKVNTKEAYAVLGQTLCATGLVSLYGMTYAAHAYYKFPMFAPPLAAFALMTLITAAAFMLAVRMHAQVVTILGMLGGFLTPVLCSTGQDNPLGLFGYIALLDIGVLAVAKYRRWHYLAALAAAGTIVLQMGWFYKFFDAGSYAEGAKTWVPVAVFTGFAFLFVAAAWWSSKTREDDDLYPAGAALGLCGSAMIAAFIFLAHSSIAERPVTLYTFVLLINLLAMAAAWTQPRLGHAPLLAGLASFAHLAAWTTQQLTPDLLMPALGIYLVFGLLHTGFSLLWQRKQGVRLTLNAAWVPVATLLLVFIPVQQLEPVSLMVWPAMLLVDVAILGLAFVWRTLLPVYAALLVTLLTALRWLFKLPATGTDSVTAFLCVLGGFAMVFIAVSSVLARKFKADEGLSATDERLLRWLPACSAVLPFLLLILATLQLEMPNPSPVFGLALLLCLFLIGAGTVTRLSALPVAALLSVLALEATWHARHFNTAEAVWPLVWYLGFYTLFSVWPHVFRRRMEALVEPWAVAAVAGLGSFGLTYWLVKDAWPNEVMGLLPAAFAVPALAGLFAVYRRHAADNPARLAQLAWFGGVALCFITLIFPIQFENQWLTIAWALEGAALIWLFRRVPHDGLRWTGAGLLGVSFARLALHHGALGVHVAGDLPIWNWQLYAYGVTALAHFLAAWWLAPPRHMLRNVNLRSLCCILGGVLLFLLLNIEITDAFTPHGSSSPVFDFGDNFARDMTVSIGWGLFALALLVIGFTLRSLPARYAGAGLLAVTLLKVFAHDLANIESIYRIGALIAVALIALAASFLYQRSLRRTATAEGPPAGGEA